MARQILRVFLLVFATVCSCGLWLQAQITLPTDPAEARAAVAMLVAYLNSQNGRDILSDRLGSAINITARVDSSALVYVYQIDGYEPGSRQGMRELTRISVASSRSNEAQSRNMALFCDLLKVAGYDFRADFESGGQLKCSISFTPEQFKDLFTAPIETLNLDYNLALDELLANIQRGLDQEVAEVPDFKSLSHNIS